MIRTEQKEENGFLPHSLSNLEVLNKGARIGGRRFNKVIGLVGGGTGIEALVTVEQSPMTAIVVIDPVARLGKMITEQLVDMPSTGYHRLNWQFLTTDKEIQARHPQIVEAYTLGNACWTAINETLLAHRQMARLHAGRIFFINKSFSDLAVDRPVFDEVRLLYPCPSIDEDINLFNFMAKSLRNRAKLRIITESDDTYWKYTIYGGKHVTRHGRVYRSGGIQHPLSLTDLVLGQTGFYFVDIQKRDDQFPIPNRLQFGMNQIPVAWALSKFIQGGLAQQGREIISENQYFDTLFASY